MHTRTCAIITATSSTLTLQAYYRGLIEAETTARTHLHSAVADEGVVRARALADIARTRFLKERMEAMVDMERLLLGVKHYDRSSPYSSCPSRESIKGSVSLLFVSWSAPRSCARFLPH